MIIANALLFSIIAGILNGSFAMPTKHIKANAGSIWFYFAFWAFIIIPLGTFLIVDPAFYKLLFAVPSSAVLVPLIAGLIWGVGMVCFSEALKYIGIGVAFVINIGIGTAGGTLIPLLFFPQQQVSSLFVSFVIVAVLLLLLGVLLAGFAAHQREKEMVNSVVNCSTNMTVLALAITIFAGVSSAVQGASYAYALGAYSVLESAHGTLILAILPWFFVFLGGFIPYVIYFTILKMKEHKKIKARLTFKERLLIIAMAVMFFESIVFYAKASQTLGALGPIIAWPLFMIFIILVSNFWGFNHGEWRGVSRGAQVKISCAILLLVIAVIILMFASLFR